MGKISRVISLIQNRDVRKFLAFSFFHPFTLFNGATDASRPEFLAEYDSVKWHFFAENYLIKKKRFVDSHVQASRGEIIPTDG